MGWILAALLITVPAAAEIRPRDGLCDGILHAAGLGIASGKVVLVQRSSDGRVQPIGGKLGEARVMPAFELTIHSAAVVMRIVF